MKKKVIWMHRDKDWIKANPGKPTMYKVETDESYSSEKDKKSCIESIEHLKLLTPTAYTMRQRNLSDAGIYVIICEIEKRVYVGQSGNVGSRLRNHKMVIQKLVKRGSDQKWSDNYAYIKMCEHVLKHSMDRFTFEKYLPMPNSNERDRLQKEAEVCFEFMKDGYKLYNRYVLREVWENFIYCPPEIENEIRQVINERMKILPY